MAKGTKVGQQRWNARSGRWQSWTGRRWEQALFSSSPQTLCSPTPLTDAPVVDAAERERLLDQVIEASALQGADVVARHPARAVFSTTRPVSHVVHLLLTILSAGVWGIAWIALASGREDVRWVVSVDDRGHAWRRDPA